MKKKNWKTKVFLYIAGATKKHNLVEFVCYISIV
jgi:hypothetical protein